MLEFLHTGMKGSLKQQMQLTQQRSHQKQEQQQQRHHHKGQRPSSHRVKQSLQAHTCPLC